MLRKITVRSAENIYFLAGNACYFVQVLIQDFYWSKESKMFSQIRWADEQPHFSKINIKSLIVVILSISQGSERFVYEGHNA